MSKQITMILSSFNKGGAEKMMVYLANGFIENNIDVDLIVLRNKGGFKSQVNSRVNIITLPNLPSIYLYVPLLILQFLMKRPQKILSTQIHVNIIVMLAAIPIFLRKYVVLREANTPSYVLGDNTLKTKITRFLAKITYPLAEKYIAISKGVKSDMLDYYTLGKEKINVIYSPVVNQDTIIKSQKDTSNLRFENAAIKIISVGHMRPQKDYETLVKAFEHVHDIIDCTLFIIGNDSTTYGKQVKNIIKNKNLEKSIAILGFVENPFPYMSKADLFVLSSKWEGFGNVLVEALACGCQIVATDCPGGPREILDNGKYGKLVPVGSVEYMAKAILDSLRNPYNKEILKKRGYEFTEEKSVNMYLKFIFNQ